MTIVGTPISYPAITAGMSRKDLREYAARNLFDMVEGTASSGSTTTIVDTDLVRFANDYWNGAQVYIATDTAGQAPQTETAWVTDFVQSTGTLTFAPALTAAVGASDTYQLYTYVTKADIDRALARAAVGTPIATSLTPKTDSCDYYLTCITGLSRAAQIARVGWRSGGDVTRQPVYLRDFQMEDAEAQITLRLSNTLSADDHLWIEYYADANYLNTDERRINLAPRLVLARALIELIEMVMQRQDAAGNQLWGQRLRYWQEVETKESRRNPPLTGRVKQRIWSSYSSSGLWKGFSS